ncbi:hypothetical protein ACF08N_04000 [Streptomyces sp. NPDC015127]|uniref:hypothetical protein n=1 Tax=Streptomyces sp. NPDC015127 TaxID=3364939 RepID=UPI0037009074
MGAFHDDVTVIADGVEIAATADLRSWGEQDPEAGGAEGRIEGLSDWNGSLEVESEEVADTVFHAQTCQLRMPDGRIGDFVVGRRSFDRGLLMIEGSGDPPF